MKILAVCGNGQLAHQILDQLAQELNRRRYSVALWQISDDQEEMPLPLGVELVIRENRQQIAYLKRRKSGITEQLQQVTQDFLLIEGPCDFAPNLCCLPSKPGGNDLTISLIESLEQLTPQFIDELLTKIPTALPFPRGNLCCSECGYSDCLALTKAVVAGTADTDLCTLQKNRVEIKINGQSLPLVTFVQAVTKEVVDGLLSTLDGYDANALLEITIQPADKPHQQS
jgi:hypothetical protein